MAFDKILQCFNPLRRSRSASRGASSPVISAPSNARWLYHETDQSQQMGDDPDRDTTKLRHTAGPGFQFMSVTSDNHSYSTSCLSLNFNRPRRADEYHPGQISTTNDSSTRRHNSTTSPKSPDALHTSSLPVTSADSSINPLCSLLCSRSATGSRKSCTSQETTNSTAPREKLACATQKR